MDPRILTKPACSSFLQQARRRFSPHTNVEAGRAAIATPKKHSKHNNGSQSSFQSTDTSTIQHELFDVEKQSLRQEVEQLREALRLTTMELSAAMNDKEKELQEERVLRLELKRECQILKRYFDQCQAEGEEMLNDLLDSTVCLDDLKQKLELEEEAFNQLEESYHKVNQERDEIVDEMCVSHVENGDLFDMQEKMEQLQMRASHNNQRQAAEIAVLQQRLEGVSREYEELETQNAILQQQLIKQRRAFRRSSADATVGSDRSCVDSGGLDERMSVGGGQASSCDSSLRSRRGHGLGRFRVTSGAVDKVVKDATSYGLH
jgi:hypothetical protein